MRLHLIIIGFMAYLPVQAQNLMGQTWLTGGRLGLTATFSGTNRPLIKIRYDSLASGFPFYFGSAGANICDSATGKLLFFTNGMKLWDSAGNVMPSGDSLMPPKAYT